MSEGEGGTRHVARPPIDTRALVRIARRGGAIALARFRRAEEAEEKAGRASAIAADREIEACIGEELRRYSSVVAVVGEGLAATGEAHAGWVAAVDPIDGTDAYVAGLPTWSVSIGLLHRGEPVAGVIYLPAFEDLYVASTGVLRWNGAEVPRGGVEPRHDGFVLGYSEFHRRYPLRLGGAASKMRALGSTAYHMCLVARGAAEAAIIGRVRLWNVAAGAAMLAAVGGELVYLRSAKPVDLGVLLDGEPSRDFMVAARLGAMPTVLGRIRRR